MPHLVKYVEAEYPIMVDYGPHLPDVLVQTSTYTATTISVDGASEKFLDSFNAIPAALAGNQVRVSGCANAQNNGIFTIINRTSAFLQVGASRLTTEASGQNITLQILSDAKIASVTVAAEIDSTGTDVTATLIAGTPTVDPDGTKAYFVLTGGLAGITYVLTVTGVPTTGVTHRLVDKYYLTVIARPPKGT